MSVLNDLRDIVGSIGLVDISTLKTYKILKMTIHEAEELRELCVKMFQADSIKEFLETQQKIKELVL